jgi:hypothetical protein
MRVLFALLAVLALTACSRVNRDEVIGTYVLDDKAAEFTLQLKADGTYVHTCARKDAQIMARNGAWEWDKSEVDNPLCLHDFASFPDEDLGVGSGFFCFSPERSWQGIRLPLGDPDSPNHYFVKRDSNPH